MKKWEYKVACYNYLDEKTCWISVFDNKEAKTIEELINPLGTEGWELINVTAELAVALESPALPVSLTISNNNHQVTASGKAFGSFFNTLKPTTDAGGNATSPATETILIPPTVAGGFEVKTYRAFFKRMR